MEVHVRHVTVVVGNVFCNFSYFASSALKNVEYNEK